MFVREKQELKRDGKMPAKGRPCSWTGSSLSSCWGGEFATRQGLVHLLCQRQRIIRTPLLRSITPEPTCGMGPWSQRHGCMTLDNPALVAGASLANQIVQSRKVSIDADFSGLCYICSTYVCIYGFK